MIVNEKRGQRALLKLISEQTEQPITKMIREVMMTKDELDKTPDCNACTGASQYLEEYIDKLR